MIRRTHDLTAVQKRLATFPVTALLGARQCGKTTLASQIPHDHHFDLENPRDLARLEQTQLTLEPLRGLIVIDEIQRKPDLFPLLRYLVDTIPDQKYLILGSASRDLIRQSAESLAGRIAYYELGGLRLSEVGEHTAPALWLRGGFPDSVLAASGDASRLWRENYITTFLERDIPQLGIRIPAQTLRRFWIMLSHYHGQLLNYSELGQSFGISDMTVRKYLDILEGTFMVRVLMPWHMNVGKRLVKRPKLYLRDSGIFHALQGLETIAHVQAHPKLGASWEGYALEQVILHLGVPRERLFFWATHAGAEVDLFWQDKGKAWAVECKYTQAPRLTKSMQSALADLALEHLWVVYPGPIRYNLHQHITVVPLTQLAQELPQD